MTYKRIFTSGVSGLFLISIALLVVACGLNRRAGSYNQNGAIPNYNYDYSNGLPSLPPIDSSGSSSSSPINTNALDGALLNLSSAGNEAALANALDANPAPMLNNLDNALTALQNKDPKAAWNDLDKVIGPLFTMLASSQNPQVQQELVNLSNRITDIVKKLGEKPTESAIEQAIAKLINLIIGFLTKLMGMLPM